MPESYLPVTNSEEKQKGKEKEDFYEIKTINFFFFHFI
jgi:hypothetical protein